MLVVCIFIFDCYDTEAADVSLDRKGKVFYVLCLFDTVFTYEVALDKDNTGIDNMFLLQPNT